MGTITGISDLDSVRWPNSHWRSVKVTLLSLLPNVSDALVKYFTEIPSTLALLV